MVPGLCGTGNQTELQPQSCCCCCCCCNFKMLQVYLAVKWKFLSIFCFVSCAHVALNLLSSQSWPWTPDPSPSASQLLGLHVCATKPGLEEVPCRALKQACARVCVQGKTVLSLWAHLLPPHLGSHPSPHPPFTNAGSEMWVSPVWASSAQAPAS